MKKMLVSEPQQASGFLQRLVDRSHGVFLWVVLVCRQLRDNLDAFDELSELHLRLDELLSNLYDLFESMFVRLKPAYKTYNLRALSLFSRAADLVQRLPRRSGWPLGKAACPSSRRLKRAI
jgi:hypothetical protein